MIIHIHVSINGLEQKKQNYALIQVMAWRQTGDKQLPETKWTYRQLVKS